MISITIDGRRLEVAEGMTVLEAARQAGVEIPTLCDRGAGKEALTTCMVCVVRVNGGGPSARMVPSCATRVFEGMVVESETAEVGKARRAALELLLSDHAGPCVAPCQAVCPAHMHIDRMLGQIAGEDWGGAIETIKEEIPLPAVLGRICPDLCEKGCRRKGHDGAVSICRLKREAADRDLASGSPYRPAVAPATGKRVAVIGAGPAGLTAAYYLARAGHGVLVFDRHEVAGGTLVRRVTAEELPREVVAVEVEQIGAVGVRFELGREARAEELAGRFDAVLIAGGEKAAVKTDRQTARTAAAGVFATGAAASGGGKYAVQAVGDGHFAARAVGAFLAGLPAVKRAPEWNCTSAAPTGEELAARAGEVCCEGREEGPAAGGDAAAADAWARRQADRCLRCGCAKQDDCRLREVAEAMEANPLAYRGERRGHVAAIVGALGDGRSVVLDNGKCIACGKCVVIAQEAGERYGLAWMGRGFGVRLGAALGVDLGVALERSAEACARACPTAALMVLPQLS